VGIDGFDNQSLIQAGVTEEVADPTDGSCTTGQFYVFPWWEILPADETPIAEPVDVGDSVTVTISQVASTTWEISVSDTTVGWEWDSAETFTGPGLSAEWVVEAPSSTVLCGGECQLAPYSPEVDFSGVAASGNTDVYNNIMLKQDGYYVSVPSDTPDWPADFSVQYADILADENGPRGAGLANTSALVPMQQAPVTGKPALAINNG
jgi:hypothetical protein